MYQQEIPKIIHQIWAGIDEPLPLYFQILGDTWRYNHPTWSYEFWDNERMNSFVIEHYPEFWKTYNKFHYNIQRWDAIRYLILNKIGGMYIDFDYESIQPMDPLFKDKTCCFALEPEHQYAFFKKEIMFNNALMASIPEHPFLKKILEHVFSEKSIKYSIVPKEDCIMNTTGPFILIDLYQSLKEDEKEQIYLIPSKNVTPYDSFQSRAIVTGHANDYLEDRIKDAFALHYFNNAWRDNGFCDKIKFEFK